MPYLEINTYSACLHRAVSINVVVPDGASGPGTVPVLYLLHGMTDNETCWQRRTSVERYADETGIAVVMPDAGLSWYCDTPLHEMYFTFISGELPQRIRQIMPMISGERDKTYIGGLSMGGFGALKSALNWPERYSACICLSGGLIPEQLPLFVDPETVADFRWEDAFGALESVAGTSNDLFSLARKAEKKARIYMWCGKQDSLLGMSHDMRDCLNTNGFDLLFRESDGGHEWPMWDRELALAMKWLKGENIGKCQ